MILKNIKKFVIYRWGYSTNHKDIGTLYIVYGAIAGIVGTLFSIFIRMELAFPGMQFFNGDYQFYNVVITSHGLIMIFFMLMPVLISGFGNWLIPMLIGAPDMAFLRLNNLSFWFMLPFLLLLITSTLIEGGVGTGWTVYPPLSAIEGKGVDFAIFSLCVVGVVAIVYLINFIIIVLNIVILSICIWLILITVFLLIFVLFILIPGIDMLLIDSNLNTLFFIFVEVFCLILLTFCVVYYLSNIVFINVVRNTQNDINKFITLQLFKVKLIIYRFIGISVEWHILYIRLVGRLTKSKLHDYLHTNNRNNRLPRNYYSSRNDFTKDYVDKVVGNIDIKKIIDKNMRKDLKYSFKKMSDHPLTTEIEKIENNNEATLCTVNATITYKPIYINGQMYMLIKVYTKIINGEEVITYIVPIMYKVKVKTEDLLNGIILKWDSKFEEVITEYEQQQIIDKINELSEEGEMIVIDCDNGVIGDDVIEFKKNQTNDDFFDGIK